MRLISSSLAVPVHSITLVVRGWRRWWVVRGVRVRTGGTRQGIGGRSRRGIRILLAGLGGREWLTVGPIELGRRWLPTTVYGMCRHKGLRLRRDRSEDALLGEALAVCTPTVFGLVKTGAAYLVSH